MADDDENDYLITRDLLERQQRVAFHLDWCSGYEDALREIQAHRHDAYLIDDRLGQRDGLDLVREGFGSGALAPVILITRQDDYEVEVKANALGVADFVPKEGLGSSGLDRAIRYAIARSGALTDLARSQERYALATRAANDGIWDWDLDHDQIYISHRWCAILGIDGPVDDESADHWLELVHRDDVLELQAAVDSHVTGRTDHLMSEFRMRHADGSWIWVQCRGLVNRGTDGIATRLVGSIADVTQRRVAEDRLRHDALHDPLTGLPNRALLVDRLEQILKRANGNREAGCTVLSLDLDRFKLINDSFSHTTGDQLLVAIAARLTEVLKPSDTVARLGGDEFTLLSDATTTPADAAKQARRLRDVIERPFTIDGRQLFVRASIGICVSKPGATTGEMLRNADIAMYDAKRRGGGTYKIFDQAMHHRIVTRLTTESYLRIAVERSEIEAHYQPIVDLTTGRVKSLEVLARWPEGWPALTPTEFIPIAEECGLIVPLGWHILRTGLAALARWRSSGLVGDETSISVNISARQLDDPTLPDQILEALEESRLPPESLLLEITESALMEEPERISRIVSEICVNGVGLHLDDFGTGYSSLTALTQLPVHGLKIDRSFVTNGDNNATNGAIVRSTIALAHSIGLEVVAEGIETETQLENLKRLDCEYGQGDLLGRPQGATEMEALLKNWGQDDSRTSPRPTTSQRDHTKRS